MAGAGEAVIKGVRCVFSLFTPSFYKNQFNKIVDNNRADFRNGSIRPLFKAIGCIWVTGYGVNYMMTKSKR